MTNFKKNTKQTRKLLSTIEWSGDSETIDLCDLIMGGGGYSKVFGWALS
jgi:hypothetical protein